MTDNRYNISRKAIVNSRLSEIGGWCFGMEILQRYVVNAVQGVTAPEYFSFNVNDGPEEAFDHSSTGRIKSFSVKYSCHSEDEFTDRPLRGDNSSLGRTIHFGDQTNIFILQKLKRIFLHAPIHCKQIAFQELIDLSDGFLFHADASNSGLEVEVLFLPDFRIIGSWNYSTEPTFECSKQHSTKEETEIVNNIILKLKSCIEAISEISDDKNWMFEGFWRRNTNSMCLLQLRPALIDKPILESKLYFRDEELIFSSKFVWGIFDFSFKIVEGVPVSHDVNVIEESRPLPYDASILAAISRSESFIVLRTLPSLASRLSHEPWFLPPPEYRSGFKHAWIPKVVLESLGQEMLYNFASDGDRSFLRAVG